MCINQMPLVFQFILLVGITCYALSTLLFFLTRDMPHIRQGIGWWAFSSVAGEIGYVALLVYGSIGDPTTGEALYNLSLISWASCLYIGSNQWLKKTVNIKRVLLLGLLATLWVVYFNFIQPKFLPSAIVTAITCGVLTLHTAWLFFQSRTAKEKFYWPLALVLFVSGVHALDYPILRPHESLAMFGIMLCIIASLSINILLASMVITQFKKRMQNSERQAINKAMQDPLTGLKNRLGLTDEFNKQVTLAQSKDQRIAIIFADLDDFKIINDTYGHEDGDQVLYTVAARLKNMIRDNDSAVRIGGDEFVVMLTDISTKDSAYMPKFISRLVDTINEPITVSQRTHQVGVSIGLAVYPRDGEDLQTLLNASDNSMYLNKKVKNKTPLHQKNTQQKHASKEREIISSYSTRI